MPPPILPASNLPLRRATTLMVHLDARSKRGIAWCVAGCIYLAFSAASSVYYTYILRSSLQNDLFWAGFNTTGMQSFIADAFNAFLATNSNSSMDLHNILFTKDYSDVQNMILLDTSYPRRVVYTDMISLDVAIPSLRAVTMDYTLWLPIQYCWCDFNRQWELAHTLKRQQRCLVKDIDNGAVYLESLLRNIDMNDWMNTIGSAFNQSISSVFMTSGSGQTWLANVFDPSTTIEQEISYWQFMNITKFEMQWHNLWQGGIVETISIANALGMKQSITIKNIPRAGRDYTWTSLSCYWTLSNDFWASGTLSVPLVRINNSELDFESLNHYNNSALQIILMHQHIGPLLTIDTRYISIPQSLITLLKAFQSTFGTQKPLKSSWIGLEQEISMVPPSWNSLVGFQYYGGSPLCLMGKEQSFIQASFSFFDTCDGPIPATLKLDVISLLFAHTTIELQPFCDTYLIATSICSAVLEIKSQWSIAIADSLKTMATAAKQDIIKLNIEQIQFASNNTESTLLRQSLLTTDDSSWNALGLIQLYEWVKGSREVISFEGDMGSIALMSSLYPQEKFQAIELEIPNSTCEYFWYLALYAGGGLAFMATFVFLRALSINFSISGINLFFFNRVASFVWIGRPVFVIRGITAVILLSTAQIELVATQQLTALTFNQRSFLETAVIAGEATWLSYVIVDVLLIIFTECANIYGPISSLMLWLALVLYSTLAPVMPQATIERNCQSVNIDVQLICTSGSLEIGSFTRSQEILGLTLATIMLSLLLAFFFGGCCKKISKDDDNDDAGTPMVIPAAGQAFLNLRIVQIENTSNWCMDYAISALCGLIPFEFGQNHYVFDIKLWVVWQKKHAHTTLHLHSPSLALPSAVKRTKTIEAPSTFDIDQTTQMPITGLLHRIPWDKIKVFVGFFYLCSTVSSSIAYINVSAMNMANDFFWPGFNSSGMDAFLGNWFNRQLYYYNTSTLLHLDDPAYSDTKLYNSSTTLVTSVAHYNSMIYYETLSSIGSAIAGLRATPAQSTPWLFTQYCWVDFKRTWEMANTHARQQRCLKYKENGAVYLEAMLRNTRWYELDLRWGDAIKAGIMNALFLTVDGTRWWSITINIQNTVDDEILYWKYYEIAYFVLQWQNYKSMGLYDAFTVQSAFGLDYTITLKQSKGSYNYDVETSMKMYWAFASDLVYIGTNVSSKSLLRSSSDFIYANSSLQSILIKNGTLAPTFGNGFTLFAKEIGPFGSIDMYHVPMSPELLTLHRQFTGLLGTILTTKPDISTSYQNIAVPTLSPAPSTWFSNDTFVLGGNILCDPFKTPTRNIMESGLDAFFGVSSVCSSYFGEYISMSSNQAVFALIAMQLSKWPLDKFSDSCDFEVSNPDGCLSMVESAQSFTNLAFTTSQLESLVPLFSAAQDAIQSQHVQIFQYGMNAGVPVLLRLDLLDKNDAGFALFAWCFLWDWVNGLREVVSFEGDYGSINIVSTLMTTTELAPSPLEIPDHLALFLRDCVVYVTSVLAGVGLLVAFNLLDSKGHISGNHLFGINRVAGIVWVGRPLLFVRSLTAMCVLSTARLELVQVGIATHVKAVESNPVLTFLSAGEIGWLIYVLNDILMVYTQHYAKLYITKALYLLWFISALWTFTAPVTHTATIHRSCKALDMNLQLQCVSGVVAIGDSTRFFALTALSLTCLILCYVLERYRYPSFQMEISRSQYLSCEAKYLYALDEWKFDGIYYLDKASAAMNGMLIISYRNTFYVFDIKTWRRFRLYVPQDHYTSMDDRTRQKLKHAYPLVE
ncbi:hypothetical protein THRCLA_10169 [Thraustotheca clavata]|uniref:Uncharacterized protein n=1 Tax=Thraustotheca clavata TaxID=74557 RepID=A0A1V9YS70_9STRA|nr:hypothetical protein THRCLA_10169 [Thraustotheca clavata]